MTRSAERASGALSESAAAPLDAAATRDVVKALVLAALVLVLLAVVYLSPAGDLFDRDGVGAVSRRIEELGPGAAWLFLAASVPLIAAGVPRLFLAAVAGAAFGFTAGTLVSWAGAILGCWLAFEGGRVLGRDFVARRIEKRHARLDAMLGLLRRHGLLGAVLLRAVPVGNCLVSNMLLAVSPIGRRDFVLGSAIGSLPTAAIYALFGSSVRGQFAARIAGAALLLVALSVACWLYVRRAARSR